MLTCFAYQLIFYLEMYFNFVWEDIEFSNLKTNDFYLGVYLQTSGEAQYASDIPIQGGELYASFVVSTQVWTFKWCYHFKTFILM